MLALTFLIDVQSKSHNVTSGLSSIITKPELPKTIVKIILKKILREIFYEFIIHFFFFCY